MQRSVMSNYKIAGKLKIDKSNWADLIYKGLPNIQHLNISEKISGYLYLVSFELLHPWFPHTKHSDEELRLKAYQKGIITQNELKLRGNYCHPDCMLVKIDKKNVRDNFLYYAGSTNKSGWEPIPLEQRLWLQVIAKEDIVKNLSLVNDKIYELTIKVRQAFIPI